MKTAYLEKLANGKFSLLGEGEILIESGSKRACMTAVKRFGLKLVNNKSEITDYLRDMS